MNDIVRNFINGKIRITWNTQSEIEYIADLIDQLAGKHYNREFMRGYSNGIYECFGMSQYRGEAVYTLFGSSGMYPTYTPTDFIAFFEAQDEQEVDVSCLL